MTYNVFGKTLNLTQSINQLSKFNGAFLVQRYMFGQIFLTIRSVQFLCETANTERQTDKRTGNRRLRHNLLDGGNNNSALCSLVFTSSKPCEVCCSRYRHD